MFINDLYMQRCLNLALKGIGKVSPNPMVGCVIVSEGEIIGEGHHRQFGKAHAEVNAISDAIEKGNENKLEGSSLYVNLEPCSHFGKTPPCTNLIISKKIKKVFIANKDPFELVNGSGISKLRNAGIEVEDSLLSLEGFSLNKRFFTFHKKKRPYVILKFAQTKDGFISPEENSNLKKKISNPLSDRLVHQWRSEEMSIMIGTLTALKDNPLLTVRHQSGTNPVRIVIDKDLKIPSTYQLFNSDAPTWIYNNQIDQTTKNIVWRKINFTENLIVDLLDSLYQNNIFSVFVEGGKNLIDQFIKSGIWDELRVITSDITFGKGLSSPNINLIASSTMSLENDQISIYYNN